MQSSFIAQPPRFEGLEDELHEVMLAAGHTEGKEPRDEVTLENIRATVQSRLPDTHRVRVEKRGPFTSVYVGIPEPSDQALKDIQNRDLETRGGRG